MESWGETPPRKAKTSFLVAKPESLKWADCVAQKDCGKDSNYLLFYFKAPISIQTGRGRFIYINNLQKQMKK